MEMSMQRSLRGAALICATIAAICLSLPVAPAQQVRAMHAGDGFKLESLLGREVRNSDGDGGRIIDLLTDAEGKLRAAVIEFGGFLGLGTRKVAVDWEAVRFVRDGARMAIVVDITRDQLRATPEYKPNEPPVVVRALAN
jgi:hypothetical protein